MNTIKTFNSEAPEIERPLRVEDLQHVLDSLQWALIGSQMRLVGFETKPDGNLATGSLALNDGIFRHPDIDGFRIPLGSTVYVARVPSGDQRLFADGTTREMTFDNILTVNPNLGGYPLIDLTQDVINRLRYDIFPDGTFPGAKLAPETITEGLLGTGSVSSRVLQTGSVTADKVPDNSLPGSKIAQGSIPETALGDGSVSSRALQNYSVTADKVPDQALPGSKIYPNSIPETALGNASVSARTMQTGAVANATLQDGAVSNAKVALRDLALDRLVHVPFLIVVPVQYNGGTTAVWTIDDTRIKDMLGALPAYLHLGVSDPEFVAANTGFDILFPPHVAGQQRWYPASVAFDGASRTQISLTQSTGVDRAIVYVDLQTPATTIGATYNILVSGWVRNV